MCIRAGSQLEAKALLLAEQTKLQVQEAVKQLDGAEQLALAVQNMGLKVGNLPRWAFTEMNRWFGTRFGAG